MLTFPGVSFSKWEWYECDVLNLEKNIIEANKIQQLYKLFMIC